MACNKTRKPRRQLHRRSSLALSYSETQLIRLGCRRCHRVCMFAKKRSQANPLPALHPAVIATPCAHHAQPGFFRGRAPLKNRRLPCIPAKSAGLLPPKKAQGASACWKHKSKSNSQTPASKSACANTHGYTPSSSCHRVPCVTAKSDTAKRRCITLGCFFVD